MAAPAPATSAAPAPRRNWPRLALVAVLGLSLLGNAIALGAALRFQSVRADLLGPAAEAALFPRSYRQDFHAALSAQSPKLIPMLHALVETRARIVALGMARPFDRAAVQAEMDRFRAQTDAILAAVQATLLERLEQIAARPSP